MSVLDEHNHRISKAFLFIEANIRRPLTLAEVADASYYAPHHFHRVFKLITGKPLMTYVNRRRVEHCATQLLNKPDVPVLSISEEFGYSNLSSFGRTFKKYFGISPTDFRKEAPSKFSKIRIIESKNGTPSVAFEPYFRSIINILNFIKMNTTIKVKEMPAKHLAYLAHVGLMTQDQGYQKLMKWAHPKGYMAQENLTMTSMYLDSAKVTAPEKIRVNIGVIIPEEIPGEQGIHYMNHNPGKCVVGSFVLSISEFEKAWVSMFVWVNEYGYKVRDMPPFELYYNDYREHPENKCIVDICIPIE